MISDVTPVSKKKKQFKPKDFEFVQQVGKGKFGIIYRARQIDSGQILAIKIIPKKKIESLQMYTRLKNQIQIHSRLKFAHICELYSYFHDQNCIYLVLQYCPNLSLYHPIKIENHYFTEQEIAKLIYQLLLAVDFMQQRSVMHRDIKLQNLLLDDNLDVKLTDFGCCVHSMDERTTFCGTLEYICPEMADKKSYDVKVDIYCVGIVFYELFYIESPFKGQTQEETLKNIKSNRIHFIESVRMIPENAKSLIMQMLHKDKDKRPSVKQALQHQFFKYYYPKSPQTMG